MVPYHRLVGIGQVGEHRDDSIRKRVLDGRRAPANDVAKSGVGRERETHRSDWHPEELLDPRSVFLGNRKVEDDHLVALELTHEARRPCSARHSSTAAMTSRGRRARVMAWTIR